MDYKTWIGIITVGIAFFSYIPYFRDTFAGKTKPHVFSWLIWAVLTGIGFFGQIADNAGPGAWVTGFTTAVLTIFVILFVLGKRGEKNIMLVDWLSLIGAGIALLFWYLTKGPLLSVILITLIDAFGFFPTFRKSFNKPNEETAITFFLSGFKFVLAFFALNKVSLVTFLYPASLIFMNWLFVAMLIIRKHQLYGSKG